MANFQRELVDFKRYIAAEKGLSRNTLEAYLHDIQLFLNTLSYSDLKEVSPEDIVAYLGQLRNQKFASSTVARALISVKIFFRFLKREGYISSSIIECLQCPKVEQILPTVLSAQEVERLLRQPNKNTPQGACDRAILEILYGCGLRVSELCNLNIYDVDDNFVRVNGKGGKQRMVPIGKHATRALDYYLTYFRGDCVEDEKAPLFVNANGKRIDRISIWQRIKHYAIQANIHKNISPHTLRHAFATHLLDNDADLRIIQEMMGHAHINSTDRYMHLSKKKLKEKFYACHPRN